MEIKEIKNVMILRIDSATSKKGTPYHRVIIPRHDGSESVWPVFDQSFASVLKPGMNNIVFGKNKEGKPCISGAMVGGNMVPNGGSKTDSLPPTAVSAAAASGSTPVPSKSSSGPSDPRPELRVILTNDDQAFMSSMAMDAAVRILQMSSEPKTTVDVLLDRAYVVAKAIKLQMVAIAINKDLN